MDEVREQPIGETSRLLKAITGIQAGVLGAFAILAFMLVVSLAEREPWWSYPNLLATAFYGGRAMHSGAGWPTVSGLAFQIIVTGVAGAAFGVLFGSMQNSSRLMLLGVIWGVGTLYLSQSLYRVFARLIPVYSEDLALLGAHTVFGLILGRVAQTGAEADLAADGPEDASDTPDSIS